MNKSPGLTENNYRSILDETYPGDMSSSSNCQSKLRRSSISLQNLSKFNFDTLDTPLESKLTQSSHGLNCTGRTNYEHVESKVKQYRKMIQEQSKIEKEKKRLNHDVNIANDLMEKPDTKTSINMDCILNRLKELEIDNNILKQSNKELMEKNAENEIKIDYFRLETTKLSAQLSTRKTPKLDRKNTFTYHTPIQVINNPLKTPKSALKTPLNNACSSYCHSSESDVSSSDFEESVFEEETIPQVTLNEQHNTSIHSDEPLLAKKRRARSLSVRVQDAFRNILPCSKSSPETSSRTIKRKKKLIKFKRNRVNPSIVLSSLHTPYSERKIQISTKASKIIPRIVLDNTSSTVGLTPKRNISNGTFQKSNLEVSFKKVLNGDVDLRKRRNANLDSDKDIVVKMALAYADEVIKKTEKFKKEVLSVAPSKFKDI